LGDLDTHLRVRMVTRQRFFEQWFCYQLAVQSGLEALDIWKAVVLIERQSAIECGVYVFGDGGILRSSRLETCLLDHTLDAVGRSLTCKQKI
jgi:hypothetical protein